MVGNPLGSGGLQRGKVGGEMGENAPPQKMRERPPISGALNGPKMGEMVKKRNDDNVKYKGERW